ncbi:hypothetical protein CTAYLR_004826 [Chrysophaeum taylorii]|uniref:Thioesterase domain-containing protein n=1 Tax=Chrysophaeum taylorii TaxID=2483200 RepID=A0AAD7UP91_9STRA|nr:hypothetical protein CTAYLR_004826 [Chrysophaeum taylorii]
MSQQREGDAKEREAKALEERMATWHRELHAKHEAEARGKFRAMAEILESTAQLRQTRHEHKTLSGDDLDFCRAFYEGTTRRMMASYEERRVEPSTPNRLDPVGAKRDHRGRPRVVLAVMDCGRHWTRASTIEGALRDVADVSSLCLPSRSRRVMEAMPEEPETKTQEGWVSLSERQTQTSVLRRLAEMAVGDNIGSHPYVIVGHGVGAIFAYELLRAQRRRRGRLPVRFFVSGSRAPPNFPPGPSATPADGGPPLFERDDEALLAYFGRLRRGDALIEETPPDQPDLESDRDRPIRLGAESEARRRRAMRRDVDSLPRELRESCHLRAHAAACIRADLRLLDAHVHVPDGPLDCPITALAGERDVSLSDEDLDEWRAETNADFQMRRPPGGAQYLDQPEGQRVLIDLLRHTFLTWSEEEQTPSLDYAAAATPEAEDADEEDDECCAIRVDLRSRGGVERSPWH